jgi:hypothetical protein
MRFGKSRDPALNINHQLCLFMDMAGTRSATPHQAISPRPPLPPLAHCLPLFPKLLRGPCNTYSVHPDPVPSPALVSGMVTSQPSA